MREGSDTFYSFIYDFCCHFLVIFSSHIEERWTVPERAFFFCILHRLQLLGILSICLSILFWMTFRDAKITGTVVVLGRHNLKFSFQGFCTYYIISSSVGANISIRKQVLAFNSLCIFSNEYNFLFLHVFLSLLFLLSIIHFLRSLPTGISCFFSFCYILTFGRSCAFVDFKTGCAPVSYGNKE